MKKDEIAETSLAKALRDADSAKTALHKLAEESHKKVVASSRSTVAARKAKLLQALETYDVERLLELQKTMSDFVDLVTQNPLTEIASGADKILDSSRAEVLMRRFLDQREIDELVSVVKDLIRTTVFSHFDALGKAAGLEDPENHNGVLEVPEVGKKFCREGTGYKDPEIDSIKLQELLGERWSTVCTAELVPEQVIPEHVEYTLSVEKALEMGRKDPEVMEILRDCLTPGAPKPARLVVKDL